MLLAFSLAGCGASQETKGSSDKKQKNAEKKAAEKEEHVFDEDAALQVVEDDWADLGYWHEEDILVSGIQQWGIGYFFVMRYHGEGACCNAYYVERRDGDWKIIDRGEGEVAMTPGISISVAEVNGKKVAWGSVGESIYVKKTDTRKKVSFGTLCLISADGKKCEIPIQNNQPYLQILDIKNVKSWKALDTDGKKVLDQASCKKNYGDDVLEQQK